MIKNNQKKGFMLIELLVSMSVFTVIMLIVAGSIISVLDANSRNQNKKTALDNLNYVIESMSREMRFGTVYRCSASGDLSQPLDCAGSSYAFTFLSAEGQRISYSISGSKIVRSVNSGSYQDLTSSSELTIQSLAFRVYGSAVYPDNVQPMVIINVSGYVGSDVATRSYFNLQTTVSQRKLDI